MVAEEALAVEMLVEVALVVLEFAAHFAELIMTLKELIANFVPHFALGIEAEIIGVVEAVATEVQKDWRN